jgi:C4-dicarboxylate-specific signal transduction histidine kinase
MGSFIYWQNNKVLSGHVESDISNTLHQTTQLVNFYINRAENNISNLAADPLVIQALEKRDSLKFSQVSDKLAIVKRSTDVLENLAVMEIRGSSCIPRATNQSASSILGQNLSARDYCQGILKNKDKYLSASFMSAVSGSPALGLAIPVKNNKGEMLGFVFGSLNLNELRGYLWDLQQGQESKVELLDRYGTMFLNTEEKIEKLNDLSDEEKEELSKVKTGLVSSKNEGYFRDEDNFVGYQTNDSLTVIYEKSAVSLLSLSQILNWTILVSLSVAIVLTLIIILIFVGKITNRISRLSKITQKIAGGEFNVELSGGDISGKDETAVLAQSFNDMAGKLKDLYENLDNKVKERTFELEKSEKKTKTALSEAERLNNLMVGRELEMLKLKKEVSELRNTPNKQ